MSEDKVFEKMKLQHDTMKAWVHVANVVLPAYSNMLLAVKKAKEAQRNCVLNNLKHTTVIMPKTK